MYTRTRARASYTFTTVDTRDALLLLVHQANTSTLQRRTQVVSVLVYLAVTELEETLAALELVDQEPLE